MNNTKTLSYIIRKSPLIRTLLWGLIILILVIISLIFNIKTKKNPVINQITPPVGAPGDLITITGKDFGNIRDTSFVEFGGSKLTSSSYVSWSDTEIRVVLPANIKDGLVTVSSKNVRSKPAFFANTTAAPVAVTQSIQSTMPLITSISPEKITPGALITIHGFNFGNSRDRSKVYFSIDRETKKDDSVSHSENFSLIEASDDTFDYVSWSDNEISLYVPDGATSGSIFVETAKGMSSQRKFIMDNKSGKKSFIAPKNYIVQSEVDIDDTNGDKDSSIILRCPRPVTTAFQPSVKMTECAPEPIISDFQHTLIHQTSGAKNSSGKRHFKQNFAITVYETRTEITAARLESTDKINKNILFSYTKADNCVPSDDAAVISLAREIVKSEHNSYNIAALIYNYMLSNFTLQQNIEKSNRSVLELIKTKKGDAYDFAIIYTALLRACGIPAIPDSGVLVSTDLRTTNHWWCEFYAAGFGWIPVDPALGAGLNFQAWQKDINTSQYYFGNLDSQHILFSRGWNEIKPSVPTNKTVRINKSYALQSIWEEVSGKTIKYSSYWSAPIVIGVY